MLVDTATLAAENDVTIVGGGPVGAIMALRLEQSGHRVLLIEARANPTNDPRALALSWGSVDALQQIDIWHPTLSATPIHSVHVSQAGSLGRTVLHAAELNVPALGYVVRYDTLAQAMQAKLTQSPVAYLTGTQVEQVTPCAGHAQLTLQSANQRYTLNSRLVIIANGGKSTAQLDVKHHVKDYQQVALISTVSTDTPHQHIAYERFTAEGFIALLPHQQAFALIWTQTPEQAETHLALDDTAFLAAIQRHFNGRIPTLTGVIGQRYTFPLSASAVKRAGLPHIVFIGNAAQTLHPIAGQGLNLGIRDALTLSRILYSTPQTQLGTIAMLRRYQQQRRADTTLMLGFTDLLVECFDCQWPLLKPLRSMGLLLLDQHPTLKKRLAQHMLFGF